MDPITCCLLGICCPPNSEEQLASASRMLIARGLCSEHAEAEKIAKFLIEQVEAVRAAIKPKA